MVEHFCSPNRADISYTFRFPEWNDRGTRDSWRIRQVGVYQQFNLEENTSVWLLLFPTSQTAAYAKIAKHLGSQRADDARLEHPLTLHHVLCSSYATDWTRYMFKYEEELQSIVGGFRYGILKGKDD